MDPRTRQGLILLGIAVPTTILVGLVGYSLPSENAGQSQEPIVGALIWTGRLAFLVFLIPLFARPLRTLNKNAFTATLMRWRRNAGVVYGGIQTVHLIIVCLMFLTLVDPPTETVMVIVGAMGLCLALAMLITSFPGPTRALGPVRWKWVHKAGFHIFMFIYFYDFVVEPILFDHPTSHLFWAMLTLAGMTVRIVVLLQRARVSRKAYIVD